MASTNKGMFVILSAPSGGGKDTVLDYLKKTDFVFDKTISATTRPMRPNERDGVDYFFIDEKEFLKKVEEGYFLEYTNFSGNYYGTPKSEVERVIKKGGCTLFKIEVEGASNMRKAMPEVSSIFVIPPSIEVLKQRLKNRGTETEEEFQERVKTAITEFKRAPEYDYVVINDDIDLCVKQVLQILRAEKESENFRYSRMAGVVEDILKNQ